MDRPAGRSPGTLRTETACFELSDKRNMVPSNIGEWLYKANWLGKDAVGFQMFLHTGEEARCAGQRLLEDAIIASGP